MLLESIKNKTSGRNYNRYISSNYHVLLSIYPHHYKYDYISKIQQKKKKKKNIRKLKAIPRKLHSQYRCFDYVVLYQRGIAFRYDRKLTS